MPTPDSRSQSDIQTPIEPDFDPQAALQRSAAQRAAASNDSLSDGKTTGGIVGDSTSSADLKAAADHLDDVEFEFVDLTRLYDILEPLGEGGMGTVYRAIEKQSRHPLAIKRLKSDLVGNRRARARFQSEGNAMLKLTHENIVRFFRMGCDATSPFYVMELVAGGSLKDRLEQGKLGLDETIRMFAALASGLAHSHKFGIIHRDIKPGNILLTLDEKPTLKLSDFGIAKQQGAASISQVNAVIGTPFYMSPEQRRGEKATERSDLFSLAKTLYHAVTGELPDTVREQRIPEPIREITLKALEVDPSLRHSSVAEFAAELRSAQMQLTGPANVSHDSAQLKDGECTHCHTINPLSRKFCKAKGCGKPLLEPCPKCGTPSPVWEAICAECGADIPAHWDAAEQALENQAKQIESLIAEEKFTKALELVRSIEALTLPRWQKWKTWGAERTEQLHSSSERQRQECDRLFAEATTAFNATKYTQAVALLDRIQEDRVTQEIDFLRSSIAKRIETLGILVREIKDQVKAKDYVGLRKNVDHVLAISPGDLRVVKLDEQLKVREAAVRKEHERAEQERQQHDEILKEQSRERIRREADRWAKKSDADRFAGQATNEFESRINPAKKKSDELRLDSKKYGNQSIATAGRVGFSIVVAIVMIGVCAEGTDYFGDVDYLGQRHIAGLESKVQAIGQFKSSCESISRSYTTRRGAGKTEESLDPDSDRMMENAMKVHGIDPVGMGNYYLAKIRIAHSEGRAALSSQLDSLESEFTESLAKARLNNQGLIQSARIKGSIQIALSSLVCVVLLYWNIRKLRAHIPPAGA